MATSSADRIVSLDIIRGVAVMGIFSVNVVAFAMVEAAYFNPPVYGFEQLGDRLMWLLNFIFIDGKMRSLFSMLFGASMLLVADRAEAAGQSGPSVHYRRMAVLLLFGLAHFYLLWFGDILATYAFVGLIAFVFWRASVPMLAALSLTAYLITFLTAADGAAEFARHVATARASGDPNAIGYFAPSADAIRRDLDLHQSYAAFVANMTGPRLWEPVQIVRLLLPETFSLMLLGMAGYRSGFLTGAWSERSYRRIALFGILGGALFSAALAVWVWAGGFQLPDTVNALETWSIPAHPVMACGYAALIILLARKRGWLTTRFAAVGRAAFSNYLGTSVAASLIFGGWGLGLYGQLSRGEAWLLVPLFWLAMLVWSKPWLDRFNYGPFEWLWRSLARGAPQPMRRRAVAV